MKAARSRLAEDVWSWRGKRWSVGVGFWPGKPQFEFARFWHDGPWMTLHLGPFWIERAP